MRNAIVDENPVRAAIIEAGLRDAGEREITTIVERTDLASQLEAMARDVILINLENP